MRASRFSLPCGWSIQSSARSSGASRSSFIARWLMPARHAYPRAGARLGRGPNGLSRDRLRRSTPYERNVPLGTFPTLACAFGAGPAIACDPVRIGGL